MFDQFCYCLESDFLERIADQDAAKAVSVDGYVIVVAISHDRLIGICGMFGPSLSQAGKA